MADLSIALNRFGLGARPEDTVSSSPRQWLTAQFDRYDPRPAAFVTTLPATGAIVEDLADFRPGRRAAAEAGVRSPLAELGFRKADVRTAAARYGLASADKPASPCLASRIPYGTEITAEILARVEAAEAVIREVREETGLRVAPGRIAGVFGGREFGHTYGNGDRVEYLAVLFECDVLGGDLEGEDDETAELRYFDPEEMPELVLPYPRELFAREPSGERAWFAWP